MLAICADNLAACAFGGFKESAGFANRHRRHCMVTREEMSVVVRTYTCRMRQLGFNVQYLKKLMF